MSLALIKERTDHFRDFGVWPRQQDLNIERWIDNFNNEEQCYDGHHINDKSNHPEMAGNPNNIEFKTPAEHKALHAENGGTRGKTTGDFVDRTAGGTLPTAKIFESPTLTSILTVGTVGLKTMDVFDPVSVLTDPNYFKNLQDLKNVKVE